MKTHTDITAFIELPARDFSPDHQPNTVEYWLRSDFRLMPREKPASKKVFNSL